jgi:hypothetical protein
MMNTRYKVATAVGALFFAAIITAPASRAEAAWDWEDANGDVCNPDAGSDIDTLPPPQALIMLDRSYSMIYYDTPSRWSVAVDALSSLTADMSASDPEAVHFGLGLFSTQGLYDQSLDIEIPVPADENTDTAIANELNSASPHGLTPMAEAITATMNSGSVQNAPGGAAGVLVTDGVPQKNIGNDTDQGLRDDAVEAACNHRTVAPLYVVGLGGGTDTEFNHVLAAAGGTGSCSNGDPCAAGSEQYDASYWKGSCAGAHQASDQQGLINAFTAISGQVSCTFSLDAFGVGPGTKPWDDSGQGCAADDYKCLDINLGGTNRVHHIDSGEANLGWEFGSAAHDSIRLLNSADGASADYCTQVKNGSIDNPTGNDVSIQLACVCTQPVGDSCSGEDFCYNDSAGSDCSNRPDTCECPLGTWTCSQGIDYCQRDNPCSQGLVGNGQSQCTAGVGACANTGSRMCTGGPNDDGQGGTLTCSATADPGEASEEVCDGDDNDCNGAVDDIPMDAQGRCHVDFGGDTAMIEAETNRCKIGMATCSEGSGGCIPFEPMPEVCNGLDDDCDGVVDNLSTSWDQITDSNGAPYTLPAEYEAAACYERNVCTCEDGDKDEIEGTDYTSFLEGWANESDPADPTCVCGEGLSDR